MHERRIGLPGGQHVVHRRQRIEVDVDLRHQVLGLGPRRCDAHGNQLADIANFAGRKNWLHGRFEAGQRSIGPDGGDTLQILGNEHPVADACWNLH